MKIPLVFVFFCLAATAITAEAQVDNRTSIEGEQSLDEA